MGSDTRLRAPGRRPWKAGQSTVMASDVEGAKGIQRMGDVVARSPERGDQVRIAVERHARASHAQEGRAGTDSEEGPLALRVQCGDAIGEPDRVADVLAPVARVEELVGANDLPADVGDDRDLSVADVARPAVRSNLVQHGIHQRRVERVRDSRADGNAPPRPRASTPATSPTVRPLAGDHDALQDR